MEDLVAVARIVRPRGLKGEVIANVLTDFPDRFESLYAVTAVSLEGDRSELKVESFWFQNDRIILKFSGYDSVETAEELRDLEICVPESEAVELQTDEFFDWQLVDCNVEDLEGKCIGKVRELMRTGGTEILVIDGPDKEHLVPFAESICVEVDIEKKVIKIDPPKGLLEF